MSIKTLFQDIADAIKVKDTSIVSLTPSQMPDAIINLPSGSDIDYTNINVVGMFVKAVKGGNISNFRCQVGTIILYNDNIEYAWNSNSIISSISTALITQNEEDFFRCLKNDYSNTYKWLVRNSYYNGYPCLGMAILNNSIDCTVFNKWKWYTANDGSERDPVSFGLIIGNLTNDNINIKVVDFKENQAITNNRMSLAYEGVIL